MKRLVRDLRFATQAVWPGVKSELLRHLHVRQNLAKLAIWLACWTSFSFPVQAGVGPLPQWIWVDAYQRRNDVTFFRRTFELPEGIRKAELRGLADRRMSVFINGQPVTEMRGHAEWSVADVTKHLRQGRNVVAIAGHAESGVGAVLASLRCEHANGSVTTLTTDHTWRATRDKTPDWMALDLEDVRWSDAVSLGLVGSQPWSDPIGDEGDYYQWMQAKGTGTASDAAAVRVVPGFRVELLRSSQPGEGSWVSLTFDSRGRLIVGREGKGLLRMTLAAGASKLPSPSGRGVGGEGEFRGDSKSNSRTTPPHPGPLPKGEGDIKVETINDTLEECRGLLFAFGSLYANANNSKALYQLTDADGDDKFETVELRHTTGGGVGHGRNALALGPDNNVYVIHGNDVRLPDDFETADSPVRNYAVDRLAKNHWDRYLFDFQGTLPAGHVIRTDRDGKLWELVACGMRNPYGIDFNEDGEMFTFDADNEGDTGLSWYRPTRINHIVSGADFGWRQGSGNRPAWYPDSWPSNLDIGKSSPTGVKFGTRSNFPPPYRRALFILDWSYGRILAVHLDPHGASYRATAENFLEGRPLNVTDLAFGPDGAMYFVTGGRGTQSGLYRVTVEATSDKLPSPSGRGAGGEGTVSRNSGTNRPRDARALRRQLEHFHREVSSAAIGLAWPQLESSDDWLRHAARIAIERQPVATWRQQALDEKRPTAALTALMALARTGEPADRPAILRRLRAFPLRSLNVEQQVLALRVWQLSCIRLGAPTADELAAMVNEVETIYPSDVVAVNRLAGELLAFAKAPSLPARTIPLLAGARSQEELIAYLFLLRNVADGWTKELREKYFDALRSAAASEGGRDVTTFLVSTRIEALTAAPETERAALAKRLAIGVGVAGVERSEAPTPVRPVVREWQLPDLADELDAVGRGRDFERGKRLFTETKCVSCHRFTDEGVPVGPDLRAVGRRFGRRDLMETILNPSKVIDSKFRNVTIVTHAGQTITGRAVTGDETSLVVSTDPLAFDQFVRVPLSEIAEQKASPVSPMPTALLNTLTKEEIFDLLAYLESDGNRKYVSFAPVR
ncbi:MAG: c-type cytochrome [Planctomycetales bacterium]|nr:c-type cytochrome [Planctomycetales bacterium]